MTTHLGHFRPAAQVIAGDRRCLTMHRVAIDTVFCERWTSFEFILTASRAAIPHMQQITPDVAVQLVGAQNRLIWNCNYTRICVKCEERRRP
jgi:hypothetical protein